MEKMETRVAKVVSAVFNPLIIPTLGVLILFNMDTFLADVLPSRVKNLVMLIVFINTAILPLMAIFFMKKARFVNNIMLDNRKERLIPMIIGAFFYFFTYYMLKQSNLPSIIHFYFLGATLLVIISLFITMKWKISLHMVSMGGLTGLLLATTFLLRINLPFLIMFVILTSGLVGSSRLKLNLHSLGQVFAGYILGISVILILFFIFNSY